MSVHTNEKPFKCSICGYCANEKNTLKQHEVNVHGDQTAYLKCSFPGCTVKFRTKLGLKIHMKHHDKVTLPEFRCAMEGCNFSTTWKNNLTKHMKSVHKKEYYFLCEHCGKGFLAKSSLTSHVKMHHTHVRDFKCDHIGCESKAFVSKLALNSHRRNVHVEEKNYLCSTCGISYKTAGSLQFHNKVRHASMFGKPLKKFNCYFCGKEFISGELAKHIRYEASVEMSNKVDYYILPNFRTCFVCITGCFYKISDATQVR